MMKAHLRSDQLELKAKAAQSELVAQGELVDPLAYHHPPLAQGELEVVAELVAQQGAP